MLKSAKKCSDGSETVFQAFPGDISSTKLMVPRNFRNSINFEGMDLRAQGELEAGIGTVEKPPTRTLTGKLCTIIRFTILFEQVDGEDQQLREAHQDSPAQP